jgi:hypothetical protein
VLHPISPPRHARCVCQAGIQLLLLHTRSLEAQVSFFAGNIYGGGWKVATWNVSPQTRFIINTTSNYCWLTCVCVYFSSVWYQFVVAPVRLGGSTCFLEADYQPALLNSVTARHSTPLTHIAPLSNPQLWIRLVAEKRRNRMSSRTKSNLISIASSEISAAPSFPCESH